MSRETRGILPAVGHDVRSSLPGEDDGVSRSLAVGQKRRPHAREVAHVFHLPEEEGVDILLGHRFLRLVHSLLAKRAHVDALLVVDVELAPCESRHQVHLLGWGRLRRRPYVSHQKWIVFKFYGSSTSSITTLSGAMMKAVLDPRTPSPGFFVKTTPAFSRRSATSSIPST